MTIVIAPEPWCTHLDRACASSNTSCRVPASAHDDAERLRQAIRQLPETDRALIALHLDGFENGEVAGILGISANNAGVKLHRIKTRLTELLQQH